MERKTLNQIFLSGLVITIIIGMLVFGYVIMYTKIPNLDQKANDYCKNYGGVKDVANGLVGAEVLCNQKVGTRSFLWLTWDTYKSTTISKDGKLIQDGIANSITYIIGALMFCYIGMALTKIKEEKPLNQNIETKSQGDKR